MNICPARPRRPEQSDRHPQGTHHCRIETVFWSHDSFPPFSKRLLIQLLISKTIDADEGYDGQNASKTEAKEG